jgi:uncharacterized protein YndB with AHSA1/START domain
MSEDVRDREEIVVDCELDHPPAQVWRALTEPALLAAWLLPNDFRPEVGHRFAFRPDGRLEGGPIACEVLDLEPERRLRLSWASADPAERDAAGRRLDSVVTFDLEPVARGTRLRIVHCGLPASLRPLAGAHRRLTAMLALQPAVRLAA